MTNKILFFLLTALCMNICSAITTKAKHALLVDIDSNRVLFSKNSNSKMVPSSMSKLMTIYLVFERLKSGDVKLTDEFIVSKNAWQKQGSKMFLKQGQSVSLEDLIRGVIVQSGNDAAITIAEGFAGSEEAFAIRMNSKAKELGLKKSKFLNATGWPDKGHVMSSQDLALLAKQIINDFPEYYHYFAEKSYKFNSIKQNNRNLLLRKNIGVDGLKTGHSSAGKYGTVVSGIKDKRRLILVINGINSAQDRTREGYKLLQYGFLNFKNIEIAQKEKPILRNIDVWMGAPEQINLVPHQNITLTVPVDIKNNVSAYVKYTQPINNTLSSQTPIAKLIVKINDKNIKQYNLYSDKEVGAVGFFQKIMRYIKYFFTHFTFTAPVSSEILIPIDI